MGLCQLVRSSCRRVVDGAQVVSMADDRIREYALELDAQVVSEAPTLDDDAEQTAAKVLSLNTINFGSGYHDVVNKEKGQSGATTMAQRWQRHLHQLPRLTAQHLESMNLVDCCQVFGQRPEHPEQVELMGLFARALADLGRFVLHEFDGSFVAVVEAADGSAERLAQSLLSMASYQDRWPLASHDVHFYKRAQITAADMARAFDRRSPANFGDLDLLTAFADNLVPHVLRLDGLLRYDPDLAAHIDGGNRLEPGSRAEIEIRAHGVEAVERIVAELRRGGGQRLAMDIDLTLWSRGSGHRYKAVPRHRTRSVFY